MVVVTYIITQTITRAVSRLPEKVERENFIIEQVRLNKTESFIELVARKQKKSAHKIRTHKNK